MYCTCSKKIIHDIIFSFAARFVKDVEKKKMTYILQITESSLHMQLESKQSFQDVLIRIE